MQSNKKPASKRISARKLMWRRRWDSNPRTGFSPVYPISSRGRYDHFDTPPYLIVLLMLPRHQRKRGEKQERNPRRFLLHDTPEALKNQDIFGRGFQNGHTFSSLVRYCTPDPFFVSRRSRRKPLCYQRLPDPTFKKFRVRRALRIFLSCIFSCLISCRFRNLARQFARTHKHL